MSDFEARAARVFIYGSCVARDTVEFAARDELELRGYIARQSLISAWSDASANLPEVLPVNSAFQGRMIRNDFEGRLRERLLERATDVDAILWDLTDERHGVHRFSDGTIATRSIDTIRIPAVAERFEAAEHVEFGSTEHFELWKMSVEQFADFLRQHRFFERTIVLEVPWALRTTEGKTTPWSMGIRAADANMRYQRYYDLLRGMGFLIVKIDESAVLADPAHRWGLAPFHYSPSVYREVLRQLREVHGLPGLQTPEEPAG